jgi:hypothetical protein
MRKFVFLALFSYAGINTQAQIVDVKVDQYAARVIHEGESSSNFSISIDRGCSFSGFNSKYLVISCPGSVRIYADKDHNSSYSIALDANCVVKNVTASAILIQAPGSTRYYNFRGEFVKSTAD